MIPKVFGQELDIGSQSLKGPLVGINNLADVVNVVLTFIFPFGAIILLLVLIWGGYDFLISRGNPEKVKAAQAKITAGVIGFVLLVTSYIIVKLIGVIFGLGDGIL